MLLAINIALIPEDRIYQEALEAALKIDPGRRIPLGTDDYFVHITLLMLVIEQENLEELKESLLPLQAKVQTLLLEFGEPYDLQTDSSELVLGWGIKRSQALLALQQELRLLTKKYDKKSFDQRAFLELGEDSTTELAYLHSYLNNYATKAYNPHITLAFGKRGIAKNGSFRAKKMEIFHLGEHCSCRRRL